MSNRLVLALLLSLGVAVSAQDGLRTPQLSPAMSLTHTLGLTEIELRYSAPSVRGREILGDKVPYDVVWRAGANATTVIGFSTDVMVEGQPLPAGRYGLHMRPGRDRWGILFNQESQAWGSYAYDPAKDALAVSVEPQPADFREQLRYAFEDVSDAGATLALHWERTVVPVRIEVDLAAQVLAPAREAARVGDDGKSWQFWATAVEFGRDHGVPLEEAMDWNDRSIAARRTFTNLWTRFELLAQTGKKAEAEEARAEAMRSVNVQELQDLAHRYHRRGDFESAARIFNMVVEQGDANWWPYTMLAHARRQLGDTAGAAAALRGALATDPDPVTRSEIEAGLARLEAR